MIRETILPFKLETTNSKLTSRAGLVLVAEAAIAAGLPEAFEVEFPAPGSNRGFSPWEFARACILMLSGGGRYLDDLRELTDDEALREAIDLTVPSPDATGDWLRRVGAATGDAGCNAVIKSMLAKMLPSLPRNEYTLDLGADCYDTVAGCTTDCTDADADADGRRPARVTATMQTPTAIPTAPIATPTATA